MSRPAKKKEKVDREPLVIHEKSVPFYKAFIFPEKNPDMIVDISGDRFASSPEAAIRDLFDNLPNDVIRKIPSVCLFVGAEEVEDHDEKSPYAKNVVLLRICANWDAEYIKAREEFGDDPNSDVFGLAINRFSEGYSTDLQDYKINLITVKLSKPEVQPIVWTVTKAKLEAADMDRLNPLMPKRIDF